MTKKERTKEKRKEAERRQTQVALVRTQAACGARHGVWRLAPPSACGRARLPAFHHGTCGSDQTPPLSSSHALPGTELVRDGRYPPPAVLQCSGFDPADRSSCRPGVSARSRPGAAMANRRPREPYPFRQPGPPAGVLSRRTGWSRLFPSRRRCQSLFDLCRQIAQLRGLDFRPRGRRHVSLAEDSQKQRSCAGKLRLSRCWA
jgi:hypothetical protein